MPKSTVFGGRPRARISSQCQKRATRQYYQQYAQLSPEQFAYRSRSWLDELKTLLIQQDISEDKAEITAKLALEEGVKVKFDDKGTLKTIIFLGKTELQAIADILVKNWNTIEPELSKKEPSLPKKDPNIAKIIEKSLVETGKPGDVALFGRMMASLPTVNVDASVQVAHAISVNTLQQEFDFFTAVDDLGGNEEQGADHMGETGYNSSTYYRYAVLDVKQLTENLGSKDHVADISQAFAEAFIKAIPSGHQNSFAPNTCPQAIMLVVRQDQPFSLVNAFEKPITPSNHSLLENTLTALDEHWGEIVKMYGESGVIYKGIVTLTKLEKCLKVLESSKVDSLDQLLKNAIKALLNQGEK
jgi:CRISPR system Cascade subunit CasC